MQAYRDLRQEALPPEACLPQPRSKNHARTVFKNRFSDLPLSHVTNCSCCQKLVGKAEWPNRDDAFAVEAVPGALGLKGATSILETQDMLNKTFQSSTTVA